MLNVPDLKQNLLQLIKAAGESVFGRELDSELFFLSPPPSPELGDFAAPCFALAKELKQPPAAIAEAIAPQLPANDCLLSAQASGPYINLKLANAAMFHAALADVSRVVNFGANERVMVEYLSPNTNKPLHLGHVRNGVLGMAVGNILKATGHKVVLANLINDRGVHTCKSMLAYHLHGQGQTPSGLGIKGDHYVGQMYVLFNQLLKEDPTLQDQAQQMLRAWEAGDPDVVALWQMMNQWVYEGFATTYATLGFQFHKFYYESQTYLLGKDLVADGLGRGIFVNEVGQVTAIVPDAVYQSERTKKKTKAAPEKEPKKITLQRQDGTSLYMTQDLGTAVRKFEEYGLTRSVYVVGREQDFHFKSLFAILGQLGYEWASRCYHLSYGMVYLPEGKMKSREGTVVDADNLVDDMTLLSREEITKRLPDLPEAELAARSRAIALAAIKFYLLRQGPQLDIHFDPKESLSFDGITGPYCQYAYARAKSIVRKVEVISAAENIDFSVLGSSEERALSAKLMEYSDALARAAREYNPGVLCAWLYETARAFNQFYHTSRVVGADIPSELASARLSLVQVAAFALKNGLELLGIEAIEEM